MPQGGLGAKGLGCRGRLRSWAPGRRALLTMLACAAAYLMVLEAFLAVPAFNGATQIRPASGMGPVLGMYFGPPGWLGCALANLISDARFESSPAVLLVYFVIQLVYDALPRGLWRRLFPGDRHPSLGSSSRIVAFLVISAVDALAVTLLLAPLETDVMSALNINVVRFLNNYLSLVYVGAPLLLVLSALSGGDDEVGSLARQFALGAFVAAAVASVACVLSFVAPQLAKGVASSEFASLTARVYVVLSVLTTLFFAGAALVLRMVDRSVARPIDALAASARSFAGEFGRVGPEAAASGELDVRLGGSRPLPEVAGLVDAFNQMGRRLGESVLVSERSARERERVAAELDVAASIQLSSLPHNFDNLAAGFLLDVDAVMRPAREVGGDFYDVFAVDDRRVCALVADVSDKGVPAALFMMRAMAELRACVTPETSLGEAFSRINDRLCENNEAMLFVTALAVVVDVVAGEVSYCNAGHGAPWASRAALEPGWLPVTPGLPFGVMKGFPYETEYSVLVPGDSLLMCTDGVTEATRISGELYGTKRLEALLSSIVCRAGVPGKRRVETVLRDVEAFCEGAPQADDITVLSLSWLAQVRFRRFPARLDECVDVQNHVRSAAAPLSPSSRDVLDLDLVVEELFVNVVSHGYEGVDLTRASVWVLAFADVVRGVLHLVLKDSGKPYDPCSEEAAPVDPKGALLPGGMGVLLVRRLTDEMRYERIGGFNVLHIAKRLPTGERHERCAATDVAESEE